MTVTEERLRRAVRVFENHFTGKESLRRALIAALEDWEEEREDRQRRQARHIEACRVPIPQLPRYLERASELSGIPGELLLGHSRVKRLSHARTEVWIALREDGIPVAQIAQSFSGRDHSSVVKTVNGYNVGPAERERINWIRGVEAQKAEAA